MANSGLSQAQNDIGTINPGLNQVESDVSDLQSNMNTNFSDLVPRVETLESQVVPPDLTDALAALTARVEALENSTPEEPPADDMKLIATVNESSVSEIVCDSGFDDSIYSGYHLVISNLSVVIKTEGTSGPMQDEYSGYVLAQGEANGFYLSGTITISMSGSNKGAWTANINTGDTVHYRSAMLSAPLLHSVFGIKFHTDSQTANAMSCILSIYGYKK